MTRVERILYIEAAAFLAVWLGAAVALLSY
jgi:hypothetical protein